MKKKIFALIIGIISVISMTGIAVATGPTSATSTAWGAGNTITSQWLNSVGSLVTQLFSTTGSTSTPLGTIANQATTTGNILVASTTKGWVALAVGTNGQCPIASSTAPLGIAWGICGGSINGTLASSYYLTASGVGFSVSTNGATTTFTIASSSYLQPLNNLSELTSTSSARRVLGLDSIYMKQASSGVDAASSSTFTTNIGALRTTNNLNDLTSTSSARANIGFSAGSGITISGAGSISAASTNVAGTSTNIQYNDSGNFAATSSFAFTSSTQTLALNNTSSSLIVGSDTNFILNTSTVTNTFSYTGAISSTTAPANAISAVISLQGSANENDGNAGLGDVVTGTITTAPGTTYYFAIGGMASTGGATSTGGFPDGGDAQNSSHPGIGGGGSTWISTSTTFGTSTVLMVAGAGSGHGGSNGSPGAGSNAGYPNGANGAGTQTPAGGGTQTTNGVGGLNTGCDAGTAGTDTKGGTGAKETACSGDAGGGGGGGYHKGGGGPSSASNSAGRGGAGSSFFAVGVTATSSSGGTNTATGTISIVWTVAVRSDVAPSSTPSLAVGGHIVTGGSIPTMTNGTIKGNDTAGLVTVASSTTAYTLSFGQSWTNPAMCWASMASGTAAYFSMIAGRTTSTVFTANTALATSSQFQYHCLGY